VFGLRSVAQIVFDARSLARLPGILEAVTNLFDALEQRVHECIVAGRAQRLHQALS
jgi:hypothetical protein